MKPVSSDNRFIALGILLFTGLLLASVYVTVLAEDQNTAGGTVEVIVIPSESSGNLYKATYFLNEKREGQLKITSDSLGEAQQSAVDQLKIKYPESAGYKIVVLGPSADQKERDVSVAVLSDGRIFIKYFDMSFNLPSGTSCEVVVNALKEDLSEEQVDFMKPLLEEKGICKKEGGEETVENCPFCQRWIIYCAGKKQCEKVEDFMNKEAPKYWKERVWVQNIVSNPPKHPINKDAIIYHEFFFIDEEYKTHDSVLLVAIDIKQSIKDKLFVGSYCFGEYKMVKSLSIRPTIEEIKKLGACKK